MRGRETWEGEGGIGGGRIEELCFHARDQERLPVMGAGLLCSGSWRSEMFLWQRGCTGFGGYNTAGVLVSKLGSGWRW